MKENPEGNPRNDAIERSFRNIFWYTIKRKQQKEGVIPDGGYLVSGDKNDSLTRNNLHAQDLVQQINLKTSHVVGH